VQRVKMEDSIALEGFRELFPEKNGVSCSVRYKKRMKGYSASIAYSRASNLVEFRLGRGWMDVSQTIKKGLFQELLVKIFKKKSSQPLALVTWRATCLAMACYCLNTQS